MSASVEQPNYVFVLLYHRVGSTPTSSAERRKHTVSKSTFRSQLRLLGRVGKFVSIDDVIHTRGLGRINFVVTFDDVPRTILDTREYLQRYHIPYVICPCTSITTAGYGYRDKVYELLDQFTKAELHAHTTAAMPDVDVGNVDDFDFYRFTKDIRFHPRVMERDVIDPLVAELPTTGHADDAPLHLTWDDLRTHFVNDDLATIANHGCRHWNFKTLTNVEIERDISDAERVFQDELGFTPKHFALPYGGPTDELMAEMSRQLAPRDYRSVLWNGGQINLLHGKEQPLHLYRIMMPSSLRANFRQLIAHARKYRTLSRQLTTTH